MVDDAFDEPFIEVDGENIYITRYMISRFIRYYRNNIRYSDTSKEYLARVANKFISETIKEAVKDTDNELRTVIREEDIYDVLRKHKWEHLIPDLQNFENKTKLAHNTRKKKKKAMLQSLQQEDLLEQQNKLFLQAKQAQMDKIKKSMQNKKISKD